jgi:hypothetical protein
VVEELPLQEGEQLRFRDLQLEAKDKDPRIFLPPVKYKYRSAYQQIPFEQRLYFRTLHMATRIQKYPEIFEEAALDVGSLKKKCKQVRDYIRCIAVRAYFDFVLTGQDKSRPQMQIEDPSWCIPAYTTNDLIEGK